jgi:hypothetical protein
LDHAHPKGFVAEPDLLRKIANASDGGLSSDREPNDGPYAEFGNMITAAGWISAGPGYRRHVLNRHAVIDVSAALSWRLSAHLLDLATCRAASECTPVAQR